MPWVIDTSARLKGSMRAAGPALLGFASGMRAGEQVWSPDIRKAIGLPKTESWWRLIRDLKNPESRMSRDLLARRGSSAIIAGAIRGGRCGGRRSGSAVRPARINHSAPYMSGARNNKTPRPFALGLIRERPLRRHGTGCQAVDHEPPKENRYNRPHRFPLLLRFPGFCRSTSRWIASSSSPGSMIAASTPPVATIRQMMMAWRRGRPRRCIEARRKSMTLLLRRRIAAASLAHGSHPIFFYRGRCHPSGGSRSNDFTTIGSRSCSIHW